MSSVWPDIKRRWCGKDKSVDPLTGQKLDIILFRAAVLACIAQHRNIPVFAHHLFNALSDLGKDHIVASSDPKAFMLMRALRDMGKHIPGDVSIVGIDDVEFSSIIDPPLSTVAQPLTEMGELAAPRPGLS